MVFTNPPLVFLLLELGPIFHLIKCILALTKSQYLIIPNRYDGRLLHCGTANDSDELRVLFYVTFRHADAKNTSDPSRSLLSSYQGRYNICDFVLE